MPRNQPAGGGSNCCPRIKPRDFRQPLYMSAMTIPQSLLALACTAFSRAHSLLSREKSLVPAPGLLQ